MSKLQFSQISQTFSPVNFWEFVLLFSVDAWIFQNLLGTLSFSLCKYSLILDHFKEFIACHRVCLILKGKSILFWLMVVRNWISQATRKVPWRRLPFCKMPQSTFLTAGVFLSDCQSFPFWPDVFLVCMSARVSFFSDYQCFYYIPFFLAVFYSDIWRISCWHIPLWLFFFHSDGCWGISFFEAGSSILILEYSIRLLKVFTPTSTSVPYDCAPWTLVFVKHSH